MPTQPPIPPLLQPYLNLPSSSLTLLTSTLGTSTNWLVLGFIHAALNYQHGLFETVSKAGDASARSHMNQNEESSKVVLVSWLRNSSWWHEAARKLGLNFSKVKIIDALSTGLGLSTTSLDAIDIVEKTILGAVSTYSDDPALGITGTTSKRILLILDSVDLLLAATDLPELAVEEMILGIREHVHAIVLTASADRPLIDSPNTPLDRKHTSLVMGLVHQASSVISVRELDTGVAKDVSGVVRITKGAGCWDEESTSEEWPEKEFLYFVRGDGRAKVFERGM